MIKKEDFESFKAQIREWIASPDPGYGKFLKLAGPFLQEKELREEMEILKKQIANMDLLHQGHEKMNVLLEEEIENMKGMVEAYKSAFETKDALIGEMESMVDTQKQQALALEQVALHSTALSESAKYHAAECRAKLVYVLERVEKGGNWLRLWEALPQEQKDIYLAEARDWFDKQPEKVDPELLKKLLKPPPKNKGNS
jgi:hypothetical protein